MSVTLRVGAVKSVGGPELHYGSGDESSASYTDADVLDIPLPEHTYQRPLPPSNTQSHNNSSCFGLPYQDHNYGMPPPPSPPRVASPSPPSPLQVNGIVQMEEEVKTTPLVSVAEEIVEDSVTRCICGYLHDDGYMICCDKCSVWQHIDCMGVDRNNIPESYFCELCQPRTLDAVKAKALQKRKREELAARNVLSDSSATDTDPEEAANALASMGKKLPTPRKKGLKHKRAAKVKDKSPLKLKIGKPLTQKKLKKPGKKEKENIKASKPKKLGEQKFKLGKVKNRPLLTLEQFSDDPWNSNLSPWTDEYEEALENQYSLAVKEFISDSYTSQQSTELSVLAEEMFAHHVRAIVAEIKKNRKGLKATQEISAGQVILEYKGKVLLRHDYDKECAFVNSFKKLQPFILFYSKLDVDLCVDARTFGNEARFIRRSCTPNSEVKHIFTKGKLYFVIVSQKDIDVGSEITIAFDYNYQDCSYCVECACVKNNCVVSRFWRKLKNGHKSSTKDISVKRRRLLSNPEGDTFSESSNLDLSHASPTQNLSSPVKALQVKLSAPTSPVAKMSSPVKLSNVSTLLAASAFLDEQPDIAKTLKLEVPDLLHQAPPPPAPPPLALAKSATSSRRGSRISEDSVKEEKVDVKPLTIAKDKCTKVKEPKTKDKEAKDHHSHHQEVRKERKPSSRRQSQDDSEEIVDIKNEVSSLTSTAGNESDDSTAGAECPRKMTREERKLDAIMKAFEKMEKREERRKEALARGETGIKKCHDVKTRKESDCSTSSGTIHTRSLSQDSMVDVELKSDNVVDDHTDLKSPEPRPDIKPESPPNLIPHITSTLPATTSLPAANEVSKHIKEEPSHKPVRKSGKRKRRKSRVQSATTTTTVSDVASVSTEDGNSNGSFPPTLPSVPSTPVTAPINPTVTAAENDVTVFKFIKTKKHLFDEWSNKQEDESAKHGQEMFVQCLPNPHVNTMDHLQRRNSSSAGCGSKGTESNAGSAKKRWLRQAMHEVPAPVAIHPSLSINTDHDGTSPVHNGFSPIPGTALGSPGSASPLDFVTPLKKRRLMRESLSIDTNGPVPFPGSGVLSENFSSNSIGLAANGVKQIFPLHRHSVDDRLLLHKGYPPQNGIRDSGAMSDVKLSPSANPRFAFTALSSEQNDIDARNRLLDQRMEVSHAETLPVPVPLPWVNGMTESVPLSFTQQTSQYSLKLRSIYEMEVDSKEVTGKIPITSTSRIDENGLHLLTPLYDSIEDDNRIDSSASASTVVVVNSNGLYKGVNSLIDEGSEAGCVTAKTIMDIDSPATVRIDLNAHEMEPSSLTDGTTTVNLSDSYFGSFHSERLTFSTSSECQVNSSEDVVKTMPLVTSGRSDICDNASTDSVTVTFCASREVNAQRTFNVSLEEGEDIETVDSSQYVNRSETNDLPAVFNNSDNLTSQVPDVPPSSLSRHDVEYISSSGQTASNLDEHVSEEHNVLCDSLDDTEQQTVQLGFLSRHCDSNNVNMEEESVQEDENNSDSEEIRTCDSVGASSNVNHHFVRSSNELEEELGDTAVTESHCSENPPFFTISLDNNVDSTSSELNRHVGRPPALNGIRETESGQSVLADAGCCDSNYERQPNEISVSENCTPGDESSLEGLGVSSSNGIDSLSHNSSWENYRRKSIQTEMVTDSTVSTESLESITGISQSTPTVLESSNMTSAQDQSDLNIESGPSSSFSSSLIMVTTVNSTVASSQVLTSSQAPSSFTMSPPSSSLCSSSPSSSMFSIDSTSPGLSVQPMPHTSSEVNSVSCSPPVSSSGEATPSAKKKVSLLEYRKRLKEKPSCCVSETKTSETSTSSFTTVHHKLSSTLSEYLASGLGSSSAYMSPTKQNLTNSTQRKTNMPTLATLPLFKVADSKKEDAKKKPKPEKQLSLTDRLRLEFGLDDCAEDQNKKAKGLKGRQIASPLLPPPPPPLHPPSHFTGTSHNHLHCPTPASRLILVIGAESEEVASTVESLEESAPPPPPPAAPHGFTVGTSRGCLVASSLPLVNGSSSSNYNFHQQSNISSTTVQPTVALPHCRDNSSPYLGHNGTSMPGPPFSYSQQQPASSTSHTSTQYQPHPSRTANLPSSLSSLPSSSSTNHLSFVDLPHQRHSQPQPSHSQPLASGNTSDEHPPPPPPLPPPVPRTHHHRPPPAASLSSHRQNHLQNSNGKSSKAASSSSTLYQDNRSRY